MKGVARPTLPQTLAADEKQKGRDEEQWALPVHAPPDAPGLSTLD